MTETWKIFYAERQGCPPHVAGTTITNAVENETGRGNIDTGKERERGTDTGRGIERGDDSLQHS